MEAIRILIAASGSGGHIFPALIVAQSLKEQANVDVRFIGSGRPLEPKLIDARGYQRYVVKLGGLVGLGISGLLKFIINLPVAIKEVWRILSEFKPQIIIGIGGYASVLPVLMGYCRGIPTWIHESEVNPGLANRLLYYFANKTSVGFDKSSLPNKHLEFTGNPVRKEIQNVKPKKTTTPLNILILGGSQGATGLDHAMLAICNYLKEMKLEIFHQTRPENVELIKNGYQNAGIVARVVPFIDDMVAAYEWSDIVISRAGAASVTELSIINRPSIMVPLPSSQGGHQKVNALFLVNSGKAILVEQGEHFEERLKSALMTLLNPLTYKEMLESPGKPRPVNGADKIAAGCLSLVS